jgi:hypothetical protein
LEYLANNVGFRFGSSVANTYLTLKSSAKASSDGTSQIVCVGNPQVSTGQTTAATNELIQRQYADGRYYLNTVPLNSITTPSANLSLNNFLITNLASGTIASGNTSSVNGGAIYDYLSSLPSVITEQVFTITVFGSSTTGFQFSAFTNTPQNNTV